MNTKRKTFTLGFISLLLAGFVIGILFGIDSDLQDRAPVVGNVKTFEAAYARWRVAAENTGQKTTLVMSLGYFKGLSSEFSSARGIVTLDLTDGALSVQAWGVSENQAFEVWLVHNRPGTGRSTKPELGDRMIRIGALAHEGGSATLHTTLNNKLLDNFKLDLVVVVPNGSDPVNNGLLFAAPHVLQKIYYAERLAPNALPIGLSDPDDTKSPISLVLLAPFRSLVPTLAYADKKGLPHFADLIARGEKLFFEEKFQGNGRTCGTCHPAENNLTIDPAFIATLPKTDPLFVAEFDKNLNSEKNGGKHFEVPALMREFGLILENVDGFDDLENKFVMRGTPHTFAQALSITPAPAVFGPFPFDGTSPLVLQRTGWGGDGAPGTGTLREFAIGAVTQHFTRTLNRIPGVDFRLPTDAELDAMEAFMLSLGRQSEVDLDSLALNDPDAAAGLLIFNSPTQGKCFFCHFNAGANQGIFTPLGNGNANFNTGVEAAAAAAGLHGPLRPIDGGFGTAPNPLGGFGAGTFNTPSLIEAADTPPFFHNNLVNTIEEAVEFYTTLSFNDSPAGVLLSSLPPFLPLSLTQVEINRVAASLRAINALENIRSAEARLTPGLDKKTRLPQLKKIFRLSTADIRDAIRVLKESPLNISGLHPVAQGYLEDAMEHCDIAQSSRSKAERHARINAALDALKAAKEDIVTP